MLELLCFAEVLVVSPSFSAPLLSLGGVLPSADQNPGLLGSLPLAPSL